MTTRARKLSSLLDHSGGLAVDGTHTDIQTQDANTYTRITATDGSAQLGLYRAGASAGGFYIGGDADKFRIYDSAFTERMAVDSSGRVTAPYQPRAWMAKTNGNQHHTSGTTRKVSFDTSTTTNGMSFSNSDDRLTVPADGNYLIAAHASTSVTDVNQGDGVYMHVRKNGSNIWASYAVPIFSTGSAVGEEASTSDSYVVPLSANDYLELWLTSINSGSNDFRISTARLTAYLVG